MKVKTKDLKTALEVVAPGLAEKGFIEQTTNFAFTNNSIFTYNDTICVSHPIEGCVLECAVQADLFSKFVNKVSTKEVEIIEKEKELNLKAGRSRTGFPIDKEIKLPTDNLFLEDEWQDLPKDFVEAIMFVSSACDSDKDKVKLNSIHISKDGCVEATDRMRLSNWVLEEPIEMGDSFLVPSDSIKKAMKINPTQIMWDESWVHFRNDVGTTLSCRYIDEDFMDTSKVLELPKDKATTIKFNKNIIPALERAEVFAKRPDEDEVLIISILDGKVKIRAQSESGSWFEEFVSIKHKGKKFKFAITAEQLLKIMKNTNTCKIYKDRIIFTGDRWVHLTSLKPLPKDSK